MILTTAATCLALNIYHEARNEPIDGQLMVAEVTINRVNSKRFPNSICAVVKQDKGKGKYDCQFSWYCDGKTDKPKEKSAWIIAQLIANEVIELPKGVTPFNTRATHYHVCKMSINGKCKKSPYWASKINIIGQIGSHRFYE